MYLVVSYNPFNLFKNITALFYPKKVYHILGREVYTVVNEKMSTGTYTKQWDAANFSSGVYFYRLDVDGYFQIKKLLLSK